MPRRPSRRVPTVLLEPPEAATEDWLPWLAGQLSEAGREVRQLAAPPPDGLELTDWLLVLREGTAGLAEDGYDLLAHSAACLLWMHHAEDPGAISRPARVALVAPPSPQVARLRWPALHPVPLQVDALRRAADGTVLVGGDQDPDCPNGVAASYGAPLKMAATVVAGAGGLNATSGYGRWPAVLDWCGRDNLAFIA